MAITEGIERRLESLRPELARQGVQRHADVFRPTSVIDRATSNLGLVLAVGGVLV